MRPIDADALKKTLEDMCSASNNIKQRRIEDIMLHEVLLQIIDDEPTVDYAPAVYCKDCKYRKEHHYEDAGEPPYIKYSCKFTKYSMSAMGYCSMGKKDGDEHEQEQR